MALSMSGESTTLPTNAGEMGTCSPRGVWAAPPPLLTTRRILVLLNPEGRSLAGFSLCQPGCCQVCLGPLLAPQRSRSWALVPRRTLGSVFLSSPRTQSTPPHRLPPSHEALTSGRACAIPLPASHSISNPAAQFSCSHRSSRGPFSSLFRL